MIHLFEKGPKTEDCIYGIREITNENPFEKGPCIITIIAVPDHLKYINGALRLTANLVNPKIDKKIDKKKRILGIGYGNYYEKSGELTSRHPKTEDIDEFIEKYFKPILTKNEAKLDVLKAMKNIRNVTFLTYCNGDTNYARIENRLIEFLTKYGYTNTEISLIISQICVVTITSHNLKKRDNKAVIFNFGDVDDKIFEEEYDIRRRLCNGVPLCFDGVRFANYDSYISCVTYDCEDHSLYRYMDYDKRTSSLISTILNTSLDNAYLNKKSDIIIPLTYEQIGSKLENKLIEMEEEKERIRKH